MRFPLRWFGRLSSLILLFLSISLFFNLRTYQALTAEIPVAKLHFQKKSHQHYLLTLQIAEQKPQQFELQGDEWQLDARMLKWKPLQVIFGSKTVFRLEHISGRFYDIQRERQEKTIYTLSENDGLHVWEILRKTPQNFTGVDAVYGSAVYMPMTDQANYQVTMGLTGLIARPLNINAQQAILHWQ